MKNFLNRHSLVIGLTLMFLYTWTIDLSNLGILPFKVPFLVAITLGWGFIFLSLIMTWLTLGRDEMTRLFKRFFLWRVDWKWWMVALLLLPALRFAALLLTTLLTGAPADFSRPMIRDVVSLDAPLFMLVVPWIIFEILTNGEEMGWRGYVLPRLQAKYNALIASLIVGVIWAAWHMPKFFGTGVSDERSFAWFTVAHLALAVLYTWLYNNTRGSLLLVTLFHASGNTFGVFMPAKFAVAGGILSNLEIVFFVIAAIVVTVIAGAKNLSRTDERQLQGVTMKNKNQSGALRKVHILALLTALLSSLATPVAAQTDGVETGEEMSVTLDQFQGPTDAAEMESFMDDLFARHMEEFHIAGAAVAVVKDGQLFFAKGYGYADVENKIFVDAETTMFKIGSLTKLFTWTAVMQLVEQGKLDLGADINTYLDFRIPDTYPQPITLAHLMAHTSGFEDIHADLVKWDEANLTSPREWLVSHIPTRVRPSGDVAAYSNYNAALAGYIVARASGQSYSKYVQAHILTPLGMNSTSAQYPTPPKLRAQESIGYMYEDGYQIVPQLLTPEDLYPAGVMRASAMDMARYMIVHLQDGFYGDTATEMRILEEATARQMHGTLFTPHPNILGNAYGFFEFSDNGQRVIGHSGSGEPMESMLLLLPDQNIGVFVAYNSLGAGELNRQHFGFQRAFFDHYYPAPAVEPIQPPSDFAARADRFVGAYKWTMSSYTTLEKFFALTGPTINVIDPGDGTLLLESPFGDWQIVEEEALYFRFVDSSYHVAFRADDQGRIVYLFTDLTPMMSFEKVPWYETLAFNMPLLMISLLLFLSMLIVEFIRFLHSRRLIAHQKPSPLPGRAASRLAVVISVLNLLFIIGTVMWGQQIVFGVPFAYKVTLGLGILSALLTVAALVYAMLAWKDRYWGVAFRTYYTLVTLAAVAFVWFLNQWNLLGWRY